MKQTLSSICALMSLAAMPLLAGKRIEMQSTDLTTNKTAPNSILLEADRMRVDQGNTTVMFLTKGGNRIVMLDKGKNEYSEMTQADVEQISQQLNGAMAQMQEAMKNIPPAQRAQMEAMMKGRMGGAAAAAPAPPNYTAKGSATVNGFRCTNYDGIQNGQKVSEICAAQPSEIKINPADFQVMQKMQEMFKGLSSSPIGSAIPASGIMQSGIDGFPVQSTSFRNGQASSREELKSITDATFSDADFSTGNAKKVDMGIGGRGKGK
jgi:hypothetical protein